MKTLILTVPHSGTNFLVKFLVAVLGLHGNSDAEDITQEMTCDFAHTHPSSGRNKEHPIPDGVYDSVIITLRHPHKSTQTGKLRGANTVQMADSWNELIEQSNKYKTILFLTIDGPEEDRFPQLMAIAKHFNKEYLEPAVRKYADSWKPVNMSLTDEDKSAMEFAVRMYEQWC